MWRVISTAFHRRKPLVPEEDPRASKVSLVVPITLYTTHTDITLPKYGDVRKHCPAILLSLEGKAKDSVLELDIDNIAKAGGVLIIIAKLDNLYLKDKTQTAYKAYNKFEKFQRSYFDMSIKDFV